MVNKNSLETGRICVMEGSRQVLVKVMLFQLQEHFHPHDGATPNFFNESRSSLLVLSIDVSFVSKFLWKGDKNFENQTSGPIYMEDPVYQCVCPDTLASKDIVTQVNHIFGIKFI